VPRYETQLLEGAEDDAREAYLYYLSRSLRVAEEFQERLDEAMEDLQEAAHQYQIVHDPIRRHQLEQFPHGLMYEIDGDTVVVHAVAHPRREPEFWRNRCD
jgi:hypothetical protein